MNLYLSSLPTEFLRAYTDRHPEEKLNILVSYGLRTQSLADFIFDYKDRINSLILDSGTFTMNFAQKKETRDRINFPGYRAFLKALSSNFDYAFNFDSNFHDHGQAENDEYMKILHGDGLSVVPVVHSYSEQEVEYYLEQGHKVIALGFSADKKTKENIDKLTRLIHGAGAKVHVLGVSTWNDLANTPVAYCDSSSWMQYGRYGVIQYWNEAKNVPDGADKTDSIYFKDYLEVPKRGKHSFLEYEHREALYAWIKETFGWEYYELMEPDAMMKRTLVNIHYFVQLQKRITERHSKLGFDT